MEPIELLQEVESLYRRVLDLTLEIEHCLRDGMLASVPTLLSEKVTAIGSAQQRMALLKSPGVDTENADFQGGLEKLAAVMKDLVAAEDRCRTFTPPPAPPTPTRAQAIAAYGSAKPDKGWLP